MQVVIETAIKTWVEALRQLQGGSGGEAVLGEVVAGQQGEGVRGQPGGAGGGQEDSALLAGGEASTAGGAQPGCLPPHDCMASVQVCLRLANGVLASWGQPLAGVHLHLADGMPVGKDPLLPKGNGSSLVFHTLLCARQALLPDVWGRARVRGGVRAQLRACVGDVRGGGDAP